MISDNVTPMPRLTRRPIASFNAAVRSHLQQLLDSSKFDATGRSRDFLRFVVEETLAGRGESLNQGVIAVSVFGRKANFDSVLDPIVRVQAGRLRRSLERYYLLAGGQAPMHIELPKGSYAPVFVDAAPSSARTDARVTRSSLTEVAHDWPSVVVHMFDVVGNAETEAAIRLQEEITQELGRYGDVHVIRGRDWNRLDPVRQSATRFELRGRLRKLADDCLIRAWLVDRTTGEQLWSDEHHTSPTACRWANTLDDIGRVIAARIGGEQGAILRALASTHTQRPIDDLGAFGAILRGYRFFMSRQLGELDAALDSLHQLVAREPETPQAWLYLARLHVANHAFELTDRETPIERAAAYANQGLLLDPTSTRTRCTLAAALLIKGELNAAHCELEQALRLNADSLLYRDIIGWLMALCGDWDQGMSVLRDTVSRNPYCLPHVKHAQWADHLRRGDFAAAHVAALEFRDPTFFWRELMTTCCLGHLGRLDEARASAAELLHVKPQFATRGATLIGHLIKAPDLRERVFEGLRNAGLALN